MANTPTLPDGIPQQSPAQQFPPAFQMPGLQPGLQLPPGTKMAVSTPLPPFPPALQKKLEDARRSGSYCITVTIADPLPGEADRITVYMEKTDAFNADWLMRMLGTAFNIICGYFLKLPLPQQVPQKPQAPASDGAQG